MLTPRESAQPSSRWMILFLWRSPLMIKQGWPCYWELHKSLLAEGFWLSRLEGRQKNQKMQDVLYMWRLPMGLCNNITIAKTLKHSFSSWWISNATNNRVKSFSFVFKNIPKISSFYEAIYTCLPLSLKGSQWLYALE